MATVATYETNDQMANLIYDLIRPQNLGVKIKLRQMLSKEIDGQHPSRLSHTEEVEHYTLDDLYGILKDDKEMSYEEMREESLKNKYSL